MVAGANGGEVSGGTTGTLAWKDHSLAISGHFLLRQKNGKPQAKASVELYGRTEIKVQQGKEISPNFGLVEVGEISDFERKNTWLV